MQSINSPPSIVGHTHGSAQASPGTLKSKGDLLMGTHLVESREYIGCSR